MKKSILLIMGIFIFTGCDATYNLVIDDENSTETAIISENDSVVGDGMDMYNEPYENYSQIALPISKKDGTDLTMDGKKTNINYYNVSRLEDEIGLKFVGNFGYRFISYSNIINSQTKKKEVVDGITSLKIDIPKLLVFQNNPVLDTLTVNITVNDGDVISNNAELIEDNTYTWYLDRDNYKNKSIELNIKKDFKNGIIKASKNHFWIVIIVSSIFLVLLFVNILFNREKNVQNANGF